MDNDTLVPLILSIVFAVVTGIIYMVSELENDFIPLFFTLAGFCLCMAILSTCDFGEQIVIVDSKPTSPIHYSRVDCFLSGQVTNNPDDVTCRQCLALINDTTEASDIRETKVVDKND